MIIEIAPNLVKTNLWIQGTKINTKKIRARPAMVKLLKTKDKAKVLKAAR